MSTSLESYLSYVVLDKRSAPRKRAPRRWARGPARDARYKAWVRTLPCCACGKAAPSEAAHTGQLGPVGGEGGGTAQKASDWTCVPLCARCHRVLYHGINAGRRVLERMYCLDFEAICQKLRVEYARLGGKVGI